MATIPSNDQIVFVSADVDMQEKKSAVNNNVQTVYTMQDISDSIELGDGMLRTTDNGPIDPSTTKRITDNLGNDTALLLSGAGAEVNGYIRPYYIKDASGSYGNNGQYLGKQYGSLLWVTPPTYQSLNIQDAFYNNGIQLSQETDYPYGFVNIASRSTVSSYGLQNLVGNIDFYNYYYPMAVNSLKLYQGRIDWVNGFYFLCPSGTYVMANIVDGSTAFLYGNTFDARVIPNYDTYGTFGVKIGRFFIGDSGNALDINMTPPPVNNANVQSIHASGDCYITIDFDTYETKVGFNVTSVTSSVITVNATTKQLQCNPNNFHLFFQLNY